MVKVPKNNILIGEEDLKEVKKLYFNGTKKATNKEWAYGKIFEDLGIEKI